MHSLYIVNVKQIATDVSTAEEASIYADNFLVQEGFVCTGYFGSGKSDWFEVGGRFKDILGGDVAVQFCGQENITELCQKLAANFDYIDTDYNESEVTLEKGDWIVLIDYHS